MDILAKLLKAIFQIFNASWQQKIEQGKETAKDYLKTSIQKIAEQKSNGEAASMKEWREKMESVKKEVESNTWSQAAVILEEHFTEISHQYSQEQLKRYIDTLNRTIPKYGINTKICICHFLAQILDKTTPLDNDMTVNLICNTWNSNDLNKLANLEGRIAAILKAIEDIDRINADMDMKKAWASIIVTRVISMIGTTDFMAGIWTDMANYMAYISAWTNFWTNAWIDIANTWADTAKLQQDEEMKNIGINMIKVGAIMAKIGADIAGMAKDWENTANLYKEEKDMKKIEADMVKFGTSMTDMAKNATGAAELVNIAKDAGRFAFEKITREMGKKGEII